MIQPKKGKSIVFGPPAISEDADDKEQNAVPLWQPRHIQMVRMALLDSAEIREELKVKYLVLGAETNTSDGSARIFPVSHSSSGLAPTCPYAGRVHESNTLYFKYFHDRRRVVLRCHDEGCKVSRQLVYPITPDSLQPASTVGSRSSMHTCRHLIEFDPEDVYNEDKMRPYPLEDKIVAVLAGMGTGECLRLSCIKILPCHSLLAPLLFLREIKWGAGSSPD